MAGKQAISMSPTAQTEKGCSRYLSMFIPCNTFLIITLTFVSSRKVKADSAMTLNSYLYEKPNIVERLTQGGGRTMEEYRNRAAGHISAFEKAYGASGRGVL